MTENIKDGLNPSDSAVFTKAGNGQEKLNECSNMLNHDSRHKANGSSHSNRTVSRSTKEEVAGGSFIDNASIGNSGQYICTVHPPLDGSTNPQDPANNSESGHSAADDLRLGDHLKKREVQSNDKADSTDEHPNKAKVKFGAREITKVLIMLYHLIVYRGQLYVYKDSFDCYLLIAESESGREIRRMVPEDYRDSINKSVLSEIREWLLVDIDDVESLERGREYLNFRDVIYCWDTGEIMEHSPSYYFRYRLNLEYSDLTNKKETGEFRKFISSCFPEKETREEFIKAFALCVSDIRDLKYCFFLYGPPNTGKSVILNLLRLIVGDQWCSSVSFAQMANEFALTQLLGKRLNLTPEISGTSNKRLDIFKTLTGNDSLTACFKGKDHFQFKNEALLVFACNNFPIMLNAGEFESFVSRIRIYPFFNSIPRDQWIEDYESVLFQDSVGIINTIIEGLQLLKRDKYEIKETPGMLKLKEEFTGINNSFLMFANDCLEIDPDSKIGSGVIDKAYESYCNNNSYVKLAQNVWPVVLKQKFCCESALIAKGDGKSGYVRGYKGIRLKGIDPGDVEEYRDISELFENWR